MDFPFCSTSFDDAPQKSINGMNENREAEEIQAAEKVINAMRFYKKYFLIKTKRLADSIRKMPVDDQKIIFPPIINYIDEAKNCAEQNQKIFNLILNYGMQMLDNSSSIQEACAITQLRPADEHYMTKSKSTLKQIVRDWSAEGSFERQSCYQFVIQQIEQIFPSMASRHEVNVLVPGAGLGRFAWELLRRGFSVQGNEYSLFMLLTSNFILNQCKQQSEFTIYPYIMDFSNSWSYSDQLQSIKFPDVNPSMGDFVARRNTFSMCAGDFLQAYSDENDRFDCVASVFFLDTAANPILYIRTMFKLLKPGGVWLNFGPLTYHYEDSEEELSLELPFENIIQIVEKCGFQLDQVTKINELPPSRYTYNPNSMLQYSYHCGFFKCTKPL